MTQALLLAAAFITLSLNDGDLILIVPASVHVKQQTVNWETSAYDLYDGSDSSPLLEIVNGGGAYDLSAFAKTCLNGKTAWTADSGESGTVVVGDPGGHAVAAHWRNLTGDRLREAHAIISSMRLGFGAEC
jgi:hypothetical protein